MTRNRQIVLKRRPTGLPTVEDFAVQDSTVPAVREGQVLVRTLLLSIDPAMRGWVLEGQNYLPPVPVGSVMRSFGLGQVVDSRHSEFRPGDVVATSTGWQEWAAVPAEDIQRKVDPELAPISTALGVLGLNGVTAYVGMLEIGRPRPGETVLVSTAAGAVGSVAGQLAKLSGARVVGLTGSDEKARICIAEYGFDDCLNYRTVDSLRDGIAAACPDGVDVYFDSVGGETLDAALSLVNVGARIPICGTISIPAGVDLSGPRVERQLLVKRALMQGFLASDHFSRSAQIASELAGHVRAGRLRYREEVAPRLEDAPESLERVLSGRNLGKSLVHVSDLE